MLEVVKAYGGDEINEEPRTDDYLVVDNATGVKLAGREEGVTAEAKRLVETCSETGGEQWEKVEGEDLTSYYTQPKATIVKTRTKFKLKKVKKGLKQVEHTMIEIADEPLTSEGSGGALPVKDEHKRWITIGVEGKKAGIMLEVINEMNIAGLSDVAMMSNNESDSHPATMCVSYPRFLELLAAK